MMKLIILIVIAVWGTAVSSPLPKGKEVDGRVLYDQRQEGEWNVRADLKNFIILIIPSSPTPSSSGGLLDFLTKSLPSRTHEKRVKVKLHNEPATVDAAEETQHFIESKTAPYHVDITKAKEELAKLHPANEEIMLATSPSLSLVKAGADLPATRSARFSRAFVFTVPDDEYTVTKTEDSKKVVKKDGKKFMKEAPTKFSLELLGAENEQCGPGMERDSKGVCRTSKRL